MYQAIPQSQEKLQPNQQTPLNINYESSYFTSCIPFQGNFISYLINKTASERRLAIGIANLSILNRPISNIELQERHGLSRRTIQNATRKMEAEGFLTKHRWHEDDMNTYIFTNEVRIAIAEFNFWFNNLSREHQHIFITHGIIVNYYSTKSDKVDYCALGNININLLSKRTMSITMSSHGAHVRVGKWSHGMEMERKRERNMESSNEAKMVRQELLNQFTLTPVEEAKLLIYPDEVLVKAYEELQTLLQSKRGVVLQDSFAWFMFQCKKLSAEINIKPNWHTFYTVCEQNGLDPKEQSKARPLVIPSTNRSYGKSKSDNSAKSNYKPVQWQPDEPTRDEQIAKLTESIYTSTRLLANVLSDPMHPDRYVKNDMKNHEGELLRNRYWDDMKNIQEFKNKIDEERMNLALLMDNKQPIESNSNIKAQMIKSLTIS